MDSKLSHRRHLPVFLGPILSNFKDFAQDLDPETKGLTISNSEELRTAHNSFARQG